MSESALYLVRPGPRPPFVLVAHHLWGDADIDSDGNSSTPDDTECTELTLIRRPDNDERVDIDLASESPLVLKIHSESLTLAKRTADFLAQHTGGTVSTEPVGV